MEDIKQKSAAKTADEPQPPDERLNGVVIGLLVGFSDDRKPLVAFPGNPRDEAVEAKATASLTMDDVGHDVALLFEEGDPERPLVIGRIQKRPADRTEDAARRVDAKLDGESLVFSADREIVLRCGKASITLTRAGKVILRGTYVLSHSKGANKIRGGSVHLN